MYQKECKIGIKYGKFTFVYERRVEKHELIPQAEAPKELTYRFLNKGGKVNVYA